MSNTEEELTSTNLHDFLVGKPPTDRRYGIVNLGLMRDSGSVELQLQDLKLYCGTCDGERQFQPSKNGRWLAMSEGKHSDDHLLFFYCRNCTTYVKKYAVNITVAIPPNPRLIVVQAGAPVMIPGTMLKFGEWPPFEPPTPTRLIKILGPDFDTFLRGRRSESQGLGIGAFAYYRRIVEGQRNRIFDAIIGALQKLGKNDDLIQDLETAKKQTQFTASIDAIKHAIPSALRVDSHNPLALLHDALSTGIHAASDDECLSAATHVRVLLVALSDKITDVMQDNAEVRAAVSALLARREKAQQ